MSDILERLTKPAMWLSHEAILEERAEASAEIEKLRAQLATLETASPWLPTHRHLKRGSTYRIVCEGAALQTSAGHVSEGETLVIYQGEDGQLWARAEAEFHDGRFQVIDAPAD